MSTSLRSLIRTGLATSLLTVAACGAAAVFLPFAGYAIELLYGRMAEIITTGARVVPAKALVLGYEFRHPDLEQALRSAITAG